MHRDDPICKGRGSSQWPPSHPPVCVQKFQLKLWLTAADLGVARLEEVHSGTLEGGCLGVLKGDGKWRFCPLCDLMWSCLKLNDGWSHKHGSGHRKNSSLCQMFAKTNIFMKPHNIHLSAGNKTHNRLLNPSSTDQQTQCLTVWESQKQKDPESCCFWS